MPSGENARSMTASRLSGPGGCGRAGRWRRPGAGSSRRPRRRPGSCRPGVMARLAAVGPRSRSSSRVRTSRAGGDVPDPDGGLAAAGGGQGLAVGAEGDLAGVPARWSVEGTEQRAVADVPELDASHPRWTRRGSCRRARTRARRSIPVCPARRADGLAGGRRPRGSPPRSLPAEASRAAVGVEGDGVDGRRRTVRVRMSLAGGGVPEPDGPIPARRRPGGGRRGCRPRS